MHAERKDFPGRSDQRASILRRNVQISKPDFGEEFKDAGWCEKFSKIKTKALEARVKTDNQLNSRF